MEKTMPHKWFAMLISCGLCLLAGIAWAQTSWVDELNNSLIFYKANYPAFDWAPYEQKLTLVRGAVDRGDQRTVKTEMNRWFKMLRNRDHGISDMVADELYNFAIMVTPLQEYGISVPAAGQ
jgi:hypothetical protein